MASVHCRIVFVLVVFVAVIIFSVFAFFFSLSVCAYFHLVIFDTDLFWYHATHRVPLFPKLCNNCS